VAKRKKSHHFPYCELKYSRVMT